MNNPNDKKICFIICTNNQTYAIEHKRFLQALNIPVGFDVDYMYVEDAPSLAAGYNFAMQQSDAKYKIYLHQDVFLVYKDILNELLTIFEEPEIGMIGMVGVEELPACAVQWYGNRYGSIYSSDCNSLFQADFIKDYNRLKEVDAIDGLFIMTQYDLPWREDIFQDWDFYDVSQSTEFRNAGLKVVVPEMKEPWCIHDDGILNLRNYYKNRKIYIKEYQSK